MIFKSLVAVATEGTSVPAQIPMNHKVKGYTTDGITVYDYNPEKAKELLKEAGFENGFTMSIASSGDVRNREAQLIQADLQAIGITAEIELMEWGAMLSAGRTYLRDAPHITLFPGLAIVITILCLNLLGDGLRDALDPKLKQ